MKRCTTCNRTFTDPNLRFCIDDGTPLTDVEPDENDATVVTPHNQEDSGNAAAYTPPVSWVPGGAAAEGGWVGRELVGIGGSSIVGVLVMASPPPLMVQGFARRA